jgi:hypothetical protein
MEGGIAMNTPPYGTTGVDNSEESSSPSPVASPFMTTSSTQELAQLIAMEMQRDIDARIDWSLQQRQPAHRGITSNELGLIWARSASPSRLPPSPRPAPGCLVS